VSAATSRIAHRYSCRRRRRSRHCTRCRRRPLACITLTDAEFLAGEDLPDPSTVGHGDAKDLLDILNSTSTDTKVADTAGRQVLNSRKICDICSSAKPGQPFSVRNQEWEEHLKSKVHKRHSKFTKMTREEWIEQEKAKGLARKAERERELAAAEALAAQAGVPK
jgi:hypothetical protein